MLMKSILLLIVCLGLMVLPEVASSQIPQRLPPSITTDTVGNSVTVQNHWKVPVTIYLESGAFDRRLGVVPALATKTLPLPTWAVRGGTTVRLFAHPADAFEDLATESFQLQPPGRIGMIVRTREEMSASPPRDTMLEFIPAEELAEATLTVDNPRNVPVTVYAEAGRFDVRLGQVPANQRATLRFPKSVISPLQSVQIFVQPKNGLQLASQSMIVKKGDHLGLRVPPP
jgi:hypothetical protein